jgi:glucose-6-phosphate 1-dehydrogenase
VAIEKPFGRDLASATALAQQLRTKLHEEEIFRVDHYLGKPGVAMIRPFLKANQNAIQRALPAFIEIAMLETEDCGCACA